MTNDNDRQAFLEAAALYLGGRYRDALVLLEDLRTRHPDNAQVAVAIAECREAVTRRTHRAVRAGAAGAVALLLLVGVGVGGFRAASSAGTPSDGGASVSRVTPETPAPGPPRDSMPAEAIEGEDPDGEAPLPTDLQLRSVVDGEEKFENYMELMLRVGPDDFLAINHLLEGKTQRFERMMIARLLGACGNPRAIEPLIRFAKNADDGELRWDATEALGYYRGERVERALEHVATNDPHRIGRSVALDALWRIGTPTAVDRMKRVARTDHDDYIRNLANFMLSCRPDTSRRPLLTPGAMQQGVYEGACYYVYVPGNYNPNRRYPLVVGIHGSGGGGKLHINYWREDAERLGLVVVSPWFDRGQFRRYDKIVRRPPLKHTDAVVLGIVEHVASYVSVDADRFYLSGHSQGARFVSRFIALHPERIRKAAASATAHWFYPKPGAVFPAGAGFNPWRAPDAQVDVKGLLQVPFLAFVGGKDERDRIRAAPAYVKKMHELAEEMGVASRITHSFHPDLPHRGSLSQPIASTFFFGANN